MSKFGFGNMGNYKGRTLEQMLAAKQAQIERENERKATELEDDLIQLIGIDRFNSWVRGLGSGTWEQYINLLRSEIARAR